MSLSIKICGLSTPATLDAALDGGASHVGFIFFPKSPRNVSPEQAGRLRRAARGRAHAVAVTVDAEDADLDTIIEAMAPDMLQLHGHESAARVAEIKSRYGLPVMKALAIREPGDLDAVAAYRGIADSFLFDAKAPAGSDLPGGNGVAFDWRILAGFDAGAPVMLSGGLNAGNIAEALGVVRPAGIDVSSGVESAPGVKDAALIAGFFEAVHGSRENPLSVSALPRHLSP